ncbi:MAG: hypothetical protein ACKVIO_06265 [Phycisphaerales bacterium]|jgi:phosphoglycerol transferase MdoB-like AlkP superfamily enzyme
MKRNIVTVLFLLGVSSFLYDFVWLFPEINTLMDQSNALVSLGIYEEAKQYRIEAMALNRWGLPIALLGLFLTLPMSYYIFNKKMKNYAGKK